MTPRGLPHGELAARLERAQALMDEAELGALLLTTEPEVRYFTGFLTRFWESPTRPWFVVVPRSGAPIAVIPSIGAPLMRRSGMQDIRTWTAPDLEDDGVSLLSETLREVIGGAGAVGLPDGRETHVRMPLADLDRLRTLLTGIDLRGDAGILRRLRQIKSPAEIAKIEAACAVAGRAFSRVPEIAQEGAALDEVFRSFQMLCLDEGADWVPYLAGGAGQGGYADVISPATAEPLARGDVLMLDTGLVHDGYFCDFDRNWSVGPAAKDARETYTRLIEATEAGFAAARPGASSADVHRAMDTVLDGETGAGRLGHGLGMSLTEWPSLIADDDTELAPGMVLTLEPGMQAGSGIMVHEENIVITETGARYLSPLAAPELPEL